MLIIPIGDINPRKTTPYVNYSLIGLNILAFLLFAFRSDYPAIVETYGLVPAHLQPFDFITAMFLHGSLWHLLGNMLYLWICGDNVEDRLGHFGYLALYLGAGIMAGLAHSVMVQHTAMSISPFSYTTDMISEAEIPCIGASGAIAGILGAYLVIFPKNKIKFFYLIWLFVFIFPGVFYLASFWAIGFWFIQQLLLTYIENVYKMPSGIAYWAHIGGFLIGLICAGVLIMTGLVQPGVRLSRYRRYK